MNLSISEFDWSSSLMSSPTVSKRKTFLKACMATGGVEMKTLQPTPRDSEPKEIAWQSALDLPDRRRMVQRILVLTQKRYVRYRDQTDGSRVENASALAKRIELSLYSRAGSLEEYRNAATLYRRLQSLISLSFHETNAQREEEKIVRKRSLVSDVVPVKRRRVEPSLLLGSLPEDCLRTVFSFLDGHTIIPLRAINHFANSFLLSCVVSLQVPVHQLYQCFQMNQSSILHEMSHLQSLTIYKQVRPSPKLALDARDCIELDVTQDNKGEMLIQHLATAMYAGACAQLQHLQLVSIFSNTSRRNGFAALCDALRRGCCPNLVNLLVGGNSVTDMGMNDIGRLLESRAIPQLQCLDVRRNYIGEKGLQRLLSALQISRLNNLKYLCLGGNLITDTCVKSLAGMVKSDTCPRLSFLGLEDNFLTSKGVETILKAAKRGQESTRLV